MASNANRGLSRRDFVNTAVGMGLAAALAACSGGRSERGGGSSATPIADDAAVKGGPKSTPTAGVTYPEGYVGPIAAKRGPIVAQGRTVKLKVVVQQDTGVADWKTNAFSRWYAEQTGVEVEYQAIPAEESATKVNAMIASGDIPDVFLRMDFTEAQLALHGTQGLFIPLNQLIEDYGVETKRIFADYPDAKSTITSTDGQIYTLPNLNDCYHCNAWNNRIWIYQPWLDKLGLSMPTTPEEFEAVLEAFKTKDPNGNGKADEIPLMAYNDPNDAGSAIDSYVMNAFLYNPGEPWLVVNEGKVEVVFDKDGWRDGLRYLHGLYAKGLLAKESFTQNNEQFVRIGTNASAPILGAAKGGTWFAFTSQDDANEAGRRWRDYTCVPPLRGPGGQVAAWDYYVAVSPGQFVITNTCKNPAVALMWGDGQYELETVLRAYSGPLGENWRWAKKGEVGINGKQAIFTSLQRTDGKQDGLNWNQLGISYRSNDFRLAETVDPKLPTFEKALYSETEKNYFPHRQPKDRQLPPLYMTEEQAAITGEIATTINNHVKQSLTKFTMGDLDPNDDRAWQSYVEELGKMGLADYVGAYQEAYEAKYR
jgi:putative aldouronate transport system substrate-binding protein